MDTDSSKYTVIHAEINDIFLHIYIADINIFIYSRTPVIVLTIDD